MPAVRPLAWRLANRQQAPFVQEALVLMPIDTIFRKAVEESRNNSLSYPFYGPPAAKPAFRWCKSLVPSIRALMWILPHMRESGWLDTIQSR